MNLHDIPREYAHPVLPQSIERGLAIFIVDRLRYYNDFRIVVPRSGGLRIYSRFSDSSIWQDITSNLPGWSLEWRGETIDWSKITVEYE